MVEDESVARTALNGDDAQRVIGSVGIGFSYWRCTVMLAFAMVVLGLVTFAAMFGFVKLCDRV